MRSFPKLLLEVVHENKSLGVLYKFQQASRIWTERQRRGLVVGGDLHGRRLTKWDIESSKWAAFYYQYNNAGGGPEPFIWVYING